MKVHELIAELQNFELDDEVFVLGRNTTWGFNGEYSYEYDTCEWFRAEHAIKVDGIYQTKGVYLCVNEEDITDA